MFQILDFEDIHDGSPYLFEKQQNQIYLFWFTKGIWNSNATGPWETN